MSALNIHWTSDRLFRWLFLLVFWGIWLFSPFLNTGEENAGFLRFWIKMMPVTLTNIPLFFLNSDLLIPKVLHKRGVPWYLLSVAVLAAVFITLQQIMAVYIKPCHFHIEFKHTFPVFFALAFSTAYGLIGYMVEQDKIRDQEKQERLQSELSFLRSQISPHFIFNILNSIVYLIRSKSDLAEPVTIKLSELMRYMLYESAGDHIPLEREIDYLHNYVALQKIRFGDDVAIHLEITGDAGSHSIEPMLMIPFIENAFKHGVGMVLEPTIDIQVKVDDTSLDFIVKNKIAPDSPDAKDSSSGIGLRNVRRRLELLYPGAHRLEVGPSGDDFVAHLNILLHQPI